MVELVYTEDLKSSGVKLHVGSNPTAGTTFGESMARIPDLFDSLERIKRIAESKNEDYAASDNPFSNFDVTEYVMGLFRNERDKTFIWPIATKIARLSNLLNSGNRPNNESIDDSLLDIVVYLLLWKADIKSRKVTRPQ